MKRFFFRAFRVLLLFFAVIAILILIGVLLPKRYYKAGKKTYTGLLIKNCHVVDIANNKIHYNRQITIRNGLIYAIDSVNSPALSDTVEIVDAKGSYIMPSLWDMHVHTISLSPQLHFPLLIANGVTHVRDLGDGDSWKSDIDNTSKRDKFLWEQMEQTDNLLMPKIMEATSFHIEEIDGLNNSNISQKAAYLVEKLVQRREPFLKVQLKEGDYPTRFFYEIQHQAAQNRIGILGHLPADVSLDSVFKNGFRSVEHAWALIPHFVKSKKLTGSDIERKKHDLQSYDSATAERLLQLMAARGVFYVPTHVTSNRKEYMAFESGFNNNTNNRSVESVQLFLWKLLNRLHTMGYDRKEDLPVLKQYYEHGLQITNTAYKQGVKILAGTDALDRNVYYGISLHEELQEMVKAGLTNVEALKTATINPVEYYGLSHEYGSIEAGKKASFILLERNPLENISNTQTINMVYFNNRLYKKTDLECMLQYTMQQAKSYGVSCKFIWNMIKN